MEEIKLGDKIKDQVTGMVGIAVARTKFLNGCVQYSIAQPVKQIDRAHLIDGDISVDDENLKVIKRNVVNSSEYPKKEKKENDKTIGGPTKLGVKLRGY